MIKNAKQIVTTAIVNEGIKYIEKNPIHNFPKLINWADKLVILDQHKEQLKAIKGYMENEGNVWGGFIKRILTELHPNVRKKFLINYIVNSGLIGMPIAEEAQKKHNINVPWSILMDPTAACNLKCKGCWAAEYDKVDNLGYDVMDRIIKEGKALGIYMYIFSGGEPLVKKEQIMRLCNKHSDCMFLSFTNGLLIDEDFAEECQKAGNLLFAISVEGFEKETDFRRGSGTYKGVMDAMNILKKYGIGFGFSTCYHSQNTDIVGSDEYIDLMIEKGCMFGWYFTYVPLGKNADLNLLATPDQREFMYHRVRKFREDKPIFVLDFWNDGEYVDGCIAGGRSYFHINAHGDVEPCAFIHYSNYNIKEISLLEALKSPLFVEYRNNQPFNENMLKPCPLLDNPDMLKEMVQNSGAVSTQLLDKETVEELTNKCQDISKRWSVVANKIWYEEDSTSKEQKKAN